MQVQKLINLILERLPKFTNEFTDTLLFESYGFVGNNLFINSPNHSLKNKDYVSLKFARLLNLQKKSNYIFDIDDDFNQAIEILQIKFLGDDNFTFFIEEVDFSILETEGSRRIKFKEKITKEIVEVRVEDYQYLSIVSNCDVVDINNISVNYPKLLVDIEKYVLLDIQVKPRVFLIVNEEAVSELATKQGFKSTLFIFPPISRSSKNYRTFSEMNSENTINSGYLLQRIEEIEFLIIKPINTKNVLKNYSGAWEVDFLQNVVLLGLIKAISNFNFNDSTIPLSYQNDSITKATKSHIEYSVVFETMTNLNEKSVATSEIAYYNNFNLFQEVKND